MSVAGAKTPVASGPEDHKQALPPGFRLGAYNVARVLGVGGFGVTYLCEHAGLGVQVAVKEYLPNEIAVRDGAEVHPKSAGDREGYEWGLSRFLDEARTLARFEHPNVVRVRDCFEANNTAYIVMDYEDGEPLDALLRRCGTLTEAQLKRVLLPVADGLRQVHAAGFLHRDVKPANIFVRRSDESPVLLDFGSARQALGRRSRSVTAIASAGYSPPEQYESGGEHGPWTDIYALSALSYRAITGEAPMEATRRQSELLRTQTDPLPRLAEVGREGYSPTSLEAVDWGLRLIETERPQSLDEWLAALEGATTRRQSGDSEQRQARQPASPPTSYQTGNRKANRGRSGAAWLAVGLGSLLAIGLVWFATQQDAGQPLTVLVEPWLRISPATPPSGDAGQPFTVLVEPADAWVRILNIGLPYRAGMELPTGSYGVEASASGYVTKTETVAHGTAPTLHRMSLSPLAQSFTVLVEPADARVRILNIGSPYRAGMELAAGSYEVEASAAGYATKTETVAHGTVPTVHRMALSRIGFPLSESVTAHRQSTSLQALAEQGDADAQFQLGKRYSNGEGVRKDMSKAGQWYRKAAEQGHTGAQFKLGVSYYGGEGVPKDVREAAQWYRKAAEQGDAGAQVNLGFMYANGEGVPKDVREAVQWFRNAAEQGYASAQYNLGVAYYSGEGVPKNAREAAQWYRKAAEQGDAGAQVNLGFMYANGEGVPKDVREAVQWFRNAAEQGYASAQFSLGFMYANGEGVPNDAREAVQWYRKAAEQGYARAQYNLGFMYANGEGVPKDVREAVQWYRKAAEQGYARAQYNLGVAYERGWGVPKDMVQAYAWFNLSSAQGDEQSARARTDLEQYMTAVQIAQAQELSRELAD